MVIGLDNGDAFQQQRRKWVMMTVADFGFKINSEKKILKKICQIKQLLLLSLFHKSQVRQYDLKMIGK
jgi:hypothetical protein